MITIILISILTIILMLICIIKFPKITIKKVSFQSFWVIPFLSAILILILGILPVKTALNSLTSNTSINPLKIILLFFSMTFMSIVLDELGFFEYLANKTLRYTNSKQLFLFLNLYVLTSVLTVFTSNDIIILTFTPFIIFFTKRSHINPIPYLVTEFVAANTWSMIFIIGNPTNIYLATSCNLSFVQYFLTMWLPTISCGIASLIILLLLFRKSLKEPLKVDFQPINIKNRFLLIANIFCLGMCTILLIISSYIGLEMYLTAVVFSCLLLITIICFSIIKHDYTLLLSSIKRLPWSLAPFVISMFIIVLSLDYYEVTTSLTELLDNGRAILTYGTTSTLMCNFVNNIPMCVLYSKIIPINDLEALYATIIGSNIGAFLSPIGALAGIMWLSILKDHQVEYSFLTFIKYGIIIVIPTLTVAILSLSIIL